MPLPIFTFEPDWSSPVIERLSWLTDVLGSNKLAEQRRALRLAPRREIEANFVEVGVNRRRLDLFISALGVSPFYLPLWWDRRRTTDAVEAGDTVIPVETDGSEFVAGGYAVLRGAAHAAEAVEIASAASDSLTLSAPLAGSWPVGTTIRPAVTARIADDFDLTREIGRTFEGAIRFTQDGPAVWPGTATLDTYAGFPVLTRKPNEAEKIVRNFGRLREVLDRDTGLRRWFDQADMPSNTIKFRWTAFRRTRQAELRDVLYTLQGRFKAVWLPTFSDDFEVAADADAADTTLDVVRCGYTDFGGSDITGRNHIRIELRDGTAIHTEIAASLNVSSSVERLGLAEPLGTSFAAADVRRVSYIATHRLDGDTVEIAHHTDADGACETSVTFRSTPENRVAEDWSPLPLASPLMLAGPCGDIGCCMPSATSDQFQIATAEPTSWDPPQESYIIPLVSGAGFGVAYHQNVSGKWRPFFKAVSASNVVSARTENGDAGTNMEFTVGTGLSGGGFAILTTTLHVTGFGPAYTVQARRFNAAGSPLSAGTDIIGDATDPALFGGWVYGVETAASDGYYLGIVRGNDVVLRHYDSSDALVGTEQIVDSKEIGGGIGARNNCLLRLTGGNVVVFYNKTVAAHPNAQKGRLSFRVYSSSLSVVSARTDISDYAYVDDSGLDKFLSATALSDGTFAVFFRRMMEYGTETAELRVRFFSGSGVALGASIIVTAVTQTYTDTLGNVPDHDIVSAVAAASNCVVVLEGRYSVAAGIPSLRTYLTTYRIGGASAAETWSNLVDDTAPVYVDRGGGLGGHIRRLADGSLAVAYRRAANPLALDFEDLHLRRYSITECGVG